jgi:hypothetical protein
MSLRTAIQKAHSSNIKEETNMKSYEEFKEMSKEEQRAEIKAKCMTAIYISAAVIMINGAVHSFSNPNKNSNGLTNADAFL